MNTDERLTALIEALREVAPTLHGDYEGRAAFRTCLAALRSPVADPIGGEAGDVVRRCMACGKSYVDEGLRPFGCPWCAIAARAAEIERLKRSAEGWEADCKREMQNAADLRAKPDPRDAEIGDLKSYGENWRKRAEIADAEIGRLRADLRAYQKEHVTVADFNRMKALAECDALRAHCTKLDALCALAESEMKLFIVEGGEIDFDRCYALANDLRTRGEVPR